MEITLALMLNLVRPGQRVGYQKVIDRFFSDTGLAFPDQEVVKPPRLSRSKTEAGLTRIRLKPSVNRQRSCRAIAWE